MSDPPSVNFTDAHQLYSIPILLSIIFSNANTGVVIHKVIKYCPEKAKEKRRSLRYPSTCLSNTNNSRALVRRMVIQRQRRRILKMEP